MFMTCGILFTVPPLNDLGSTEPYSSLDLITRAQHAAAMMLANEIASWDLLAEDARPSQELAAYAHLWRGASEDARRLYERSCHLRQKTPLVGMRTRNESGSLTAWDGLHGRRLLGLFEAVQFAQEQLRLACDRAARNNVRLPEEEPVQEESDRLEACRRALVASWPFPLHKKLGMAVTPFPPTRSAFLPAVTQGSPDEPNRCSPDA